MAMVQRLRARVQRWHQLGRYYVNKWHYDGSKWADRVWYGAGSTGNGPAVASVAFMMTRNMRQQLRDAGFPAAEISAMQPAIAQKILADKLSYEAYVKQRKQAETEAEVKEAAEQAKRALAAEEAPKQEAGATIVAVAPADDVHDNQEAKEREAETPVALVLEDKPTEEQKK